MKYIPADKVLAEIDRQGIGYNTDGKHTAEYNTCRKILDIIASLQQEQPEVELEEYIENEVKHYGLSLYEASYGTFSASQIDRIIRNAFEFGLNARKK